MALSNSTWSLMDMVLLDMVHEGFGKSLFAGSHE